MKKLAAIIKKEEGDKHKNVLKEIAQYDDKTEASNTIKTLLPERKAVWNYGHLTTKEFREYLTKRAVKLYETRLSEKLAKMQFGELPEIDSLTINVEWRPSKMWGLNPIAKAYVSGVGNLSSTLVSGCGFDKQSTAVAELLNQIPQFIKLLYAMKDKHPKAHNHELFGYGSGYGLLPQFEGGVGVDCYRPIMAKIGYKWESVSWGDKFNVYQVTKIQTRKARKQEEVIL